MGTPFAVRAVNAFMYYLEKDVMSHNFRVIYFCTSSTSGLSMTYFFIWKGPKENLLEFLSFLNSKNDRISFLDLFLYKDANFSTDCSFLPIKSH